MIKKIFFLSISLLILVLIFLAAYNLIFKNNVNDPLADPSKNLFTKDGAITLFTPEGMAENPINEAVFGATVGEDGSLYYYSLDDRAIKKANADGKNKNTLMSNLPGEVARLLWSAKRDKVMLQLKQGTATNWYSAHLETKTLVPLKPEVSRVTWDNFGERIFYLYTNLGTKERSLDMAEPDGSNWKKLTTVGTKDFFLSSVPESGLISFWARPRGSDTSALEAVGASGEIRRTLSPGLYGADYLWSPDGERILVSGSTIPGGKNLSLHVIENDEMKDLAIPTLISKTVWSNDGRTIYFALPGGLPDTLILPDDSFGKPLYSRDTFWKIDLSTGKKSRLITLKDASQAFDSSDLFLSPSGDALYFTDRVTKRLYRIDL